MSAWTKLMDGSTPYRSLDDLAASITEENIADLNRQALAEPDATDRERALMLVANETRVRPMLMQRNRAELEKMWLCLQPTH